MLSKKSMDKIRKFVRLLDKKSAKKIEQALQDIVALNLNKYRVKKMTGFKILYRIRIGKVRITFQKFENQGVPIDIDYRGGIYKRHRSR